jgi:histidine triad (HIT) family protein
MEKTVFQKIINREIPADIVYEDAHTMAILDINPGTKGHSLVFPKQAFPNIYEVPDNVLSEIMITVKKLSTALKTALEADGINIIQNNERAAGQEVTDHIHFHLHPRYEGDGFIPFKTHVSISKEEQKQIAQKIIDTLE